MLKNKVLNLNCYNWLQAPGTSKLDEMSLDTADVEEYTPPHLFCLAVNTIFQCHILYRLAGRLGFLKSKDKGQRFTLHMKH